MQAGDFNADTAVDVVVGALGSDTSGIDAGQVLGFLGPLRAGWANSPTFEVRGERQFDGLGAQIAAGDLDGDGAHELVLVAPSALRDGAEVGVAYVVNGCRGR